MSLASKNESRLRGLITIIGAVLVIILLCSSLYACADRNAGADELSCKIGIYCTTLLDNIDMLDAEKAELIPQDGVILEMIDVSFKPGETVYDVLKRVTRSNSIHMESNYTPIYNSAYIEGIANLYEYDCGELSGWTYSVNDVFPNFGCSGYALKDGDVIKWLYTCDLGRDVGGYFK